MAGPANPAAPKGGFNKLFVMVPVMLAARKLDAEDPDTVQYLRIAYGSMQTICVLVVLYTFMKASSLTGKETKNIIFVPAPATPFADPDAKKKYTRVEYGAHVLSTSRSLLGSTFFGICMTVGLHIYRGMAAGLAIQAVMGPFNLFDNPLVKAILLGNGFVPKDKVFDEKTFGELTNEDEVVDETGTEISRSKLLQMEGAAKPQSKSDSFEELMLDTWDAGAQADISAFLKKVTKKNCNFRSQESEWTPLMILSGLSSSGETSKAIKKVISLGGNPSITDREGWNALHWAAFHGNAKTAKQLYEYDASLLGVKDKEGKLPLDIAKQEESADVVKYLEEVTASSEKEASSDGIRKRK